MPARMLRSPDSPASSSSSSSPSAAAAASLIDVSASAELKIKVFALKNADATETAKTLNEVFKRETMRADTGRQDPLQNMMRMFGGGGRDGGGRGGGEAGPTPRALAHEMVRITAEARTNSVIVTATEDNLKSAIEGETYEYTEMYPGFAKTARDEGFDEVAEWLETLARAEKSHAGRFQQGLEAL